MRKTDERHEIVRTFANPLNMTLTDRLSAAEAAIEAHRDATRDFRSDREEAVIDLLTNIRHLCDAEDLDFQAIARMSLTHFNSERG